ISALFCVLLLMSFNLLSARLFGELEFWFSIIKIATIIGLIVVFGLSSQQQAPPNFSKTNKYGVPHVAIFASSALLLVAALLNY
ncbi:hypothetical protein IDG59_14775, partial [Staphylococcus sp. EG-SA-1]|nr:hypothetical protein [Staphylococcus sp. EG-SA-1]